MPLIQNLFNPGMRERHWIALSEIVGYDVMPSEETSVSDMLKLNLQDDLDKFEAIAEAASKEYSLEKALKKMIIEWAPVRRCLCDRRFFPLAGNAYVHRHCLYAIFSLH